MSHGNIVQYDSSISVYGQLMVGYCSGYFVCAAACDGVIAVCEVYYCRPRLIHLVHRISVNISGHQLNIWIVVIDILVYFYLYELVVAVLCQIIRCEHGGIVAVIHFLSGEIIFSFSLCCHCSLIVATRGITVERDFGIL